jgi:cytoplasmic iron level regulating protein YaaA (DUF328/UPF0246 family)
MHKVVLISCVSKKRSLKCRARELYVSPLFQKNLEYAQKLAPDHIFILSAKYGLVELDDEIAPYDLTLNEMSELENRMWAKNVLRQLATKADLQNDLFVFLAGKKYRKNLQPHLGHVEVPLEGLKIGEQLQRLSRSNP